LTWIGVDIKPGTFRSAGPLDGSSGYWARLSDTSGEGIITNDIATGQAVVTIAHRQRVQNDRDADWKKIG
jgi:hypothetical protein